MNKRTTERALRIPFVTLGAATALVLAAAGCGDEAGSDVDVGCAEQGIETHNAMGYNSMGYNAMNYNGGQMTRAPLQDTAIDGSDSCKPSPTLQFMEYLVGCALGDDQGITVRLGGAEHRLRGQLGLAPEWA